MSEDLVQATSETDLPQNGQLHAQPDYIYDPDDWQCTYAWELSDEATDYEPSPGAMKRFSTLMQGPDIFAANVPIAWEADGKPYDHQIRWFKTAAEAEVALAASPQSQGDRPVHPHDERQREPK